MPTNTDLVTDLPADFEVFGQAVATSMADLLGGTTGQILSKTTNADMDFTWINNDQGDITGVTAGTGISGGGTSGTVTVTNSMATAITTAGDVIYGTGSGTFTRLGIGTAGQVLTVNGGATAPSWATAASGGNWTALSTTSFSASNAINVNSVFTSDYDNYKVFVNFTAASADTLVRLRLRTSGSDSTTNYTNLRINQSNTTLVAAKNPDSSTDYFWLAYASSPYGEMLNEFTLYRPFLAVPTMYESTSMTGDEQQRITSRHTTATSYDGFSITTPSATLTGTVRVFGYKNS